MTADAKCGQLLQKRPAARFRRRDSVLGVAQRTQLVLRQLRQVLDLRHARRPEDRLLRDGRNEILVRVVFGFLARLDRVGKSRDGRDGFLLANKCIRLGERGASRTDR